MRSITFSFLTHEKGSGRLDSFDKLISTISLLTCIISSSKILGKQRLTILLFRKKSYALIYKSLFDVDIRIIPVCAFSLMGSFSKLSKISRPCCSSLFKRRIVREWGQLFGGPFSIVERKPSIPYSSKINLGDRHS